MTRGQDEDRRHRGARQLDADDRRAEVVDLDGATARRSQRGQAAEWRAAIEAGDATAAAAPAVARYQDSDTSTYLGEHWQEVRAEVTTVFTQKAGQWLTSRLAWGVAPSAIAVVAVDGLLPTMYLPGSLESLVDSLEDLVSGARAVGRSAASAAWNPAVGRAIGRELEESVGRATRTMAANYARAGGARSPRDVLDPTTRFERIAVELLEQGKVRPTSRPAAKPESPAVPTVAEREEVLGPAIDVGNVAPGSELTFEPANPIPVGVDARDAQRSATRGAVAARAYAEAGGTGAALAVDTARDRFDALDGGDPTALDAGARIETFLLQLGTLSQNLHHTADALFGSAATIGHVAGLPWVKDAENLAKRALAVEHTVAVIRARLTEQLRGAPDGALAQRLLANAQTELAARVSETELVELSEQSIRQLREVEEAANTIFAINTMVLSIAVSFVAAEAGAYIASSLLTALARTSATGATLMAGQAGAFVVGQITEAAINAAFQSALLGDDSSEAFAENLLASLLAQGTSRGVGRMNAAARAGGAGRMVRGGGAALELAAGAGAGVTAGAIVRGGDNPVDPALLAASVTLGHWISRRVAIAKERVATRGGPRAGELQARLDGLTVHNERLLAAGDAVEPAAVVELVRETHEVLTAVEKDGTPVAGSADERSVEQPNAVRETDPLGGSLHHDLPARQPADDDAAAGSRGRHTDTASDSSPGAVPDAGPRGVSFGVELPTRTELRPEMEGALHAVLEQHFPHNKRKRIPKALAGLREPPYGPALAEALLDPRLQQCNGFGEIVRRTMNPASQESVLAELHQARMMFDDPAHLGERIELGIVSNGTRRGDPNHFDIDVASIDGSGEITEGVQVLRAFTTDVRKALFEAMDKGNEQLAAAPARARRVVVYLQQGTPGDIAPFAATLQRYTRESGIVIEVILPSGARHISDGSIQ